MIPASHEDAPEADYKKIIEELTARNNSLQDENSRLKNECGSLKSRLEETLKVKEDILEAFFDTSTGILCIFDEELRFLNTDRITASFFGLDRKSIAGRHPREFNSIFSEDRLAPIFRQVTTTQKPIINQLISTPMMTRSGETAHFMSSFFPLILPDGRPGMGVMAVETTEMVKAREELNRERELFEGIFNNIPVMITIYDPNLKRFRFNQELKNVLGWTEDDTLDGRFMERVYPVKSEREEVSHYMQSLEKGWREFEVTAKDGRRIESSWANIKLSDSTLIGIGTDVSQLRHVENDLRESQSRLLEAQRLAHVGSFTFYADTQMLDWTEEVYRIFERPAEKGNPSFKEIMDYVHPDDRKYVLSCVQEAEEKHSSLNMEYRIITDKGTLKHLRYTGTPIFDNEGRLIRRFGTVLDITESKLTEARLKKILTELERSNRELEQFAYVASHDLQEPLRLISSYSKLLAQRYRDRLDERAGSYIGFITDGTSRMQNLISDILKYARVTTKVHPFESTDLNGIMDEVLTDLRMSVEESGARIEYGTLPEVYCDPVQIRQLLQNLISNAVKFRGEDTPVIKISFERKNKDWQFCIRDNGIGIHPEFHERVFIIFQRLHERERYSGTGIGLALCKKIVERHGGRIWVESEESKGSAFCFTLPARQT